MQYEALSGKSGGIFLKSGIQDGFVPFQIHSVTVIIQNSGNVGISFFYIK